MSVAVSYFDVAEYFYKLVKLTRGLYTKSNTSKFIFEDKYKVTISLYPQYWSIEVDDDEPARNKQRK